MFLWNNWLSILVLGAIGVLASAVAILWVIVKDLDEKVSTLLRWVAHIELLLKEKGIWKFEEEKKD